MMFYRAIDWRDSLYPPSDSFYPFTAAELDCQLCFFCSSLHLCVSNNCPIFCLVFLAGPFVLYACFILHCLCDLFLHVSCLSCVSSLSFNNMITKMWNPLWNYHTALVHSGSLIPSICNIGSFRFIHCIFLCLIQFFCCF